MAPASDPSTWEHANQLNQLIGIYIGETGKFVVDFAWYGKSDGRYWVAVDYDEVARTAEPATMMQSRWMGGSAWYLDAVGGFKSRKAVLVYPRFEGGRWALLEVIEGV